MTDKNIAESEAYKELTTLVELIQTDGSIHDLDQYTPEDMQTTSGIVLSELMHRCQRYEDVLKEIVQANELSSKFTGDMGRAYAMSAKEVLCRTFY